MDILFMILGIVVSIGLVAAGVKIDKENMERTNQYKLMVQYYEAYLLEDYDLCNEIWDNLNKENQERINTIIEAAEDEQNDSE